MRFALAMIVAAMLLAGCSSFPLGMEEEEWLALTPQQQEIAQRRQAELDETASNMQSVQRRLRDKLQGERRQRIERMYADDRYLECRATGGWIRDGRESLKVRPKKFTIARTEDALVSFDAVKVVAKKDGEKAKTEIVSRTVWAGYTADGERLIFCPDAPTDGSLARCGTINRGSLFDTLNPVVDVGGIHGLTVRCGRTW